MKQLNLQPRWMALTLAAIFSPLVYAQGSINDTGMYVGISAGQSEDKFDNERSANTLSGTGITANVLTDDQRGNAYKAFVGIPLSPNWAVETGYFDLGRTGFDASTDPAGTVSNRTRIQGLNVDLVGTLPITDNWDLLGRVGAAYAQTKSHVNGTGAAAAATGSTSERDTNYKFGFGTQYAFTPALTMRLEGERYRVRDAVGKNANVDLISVGLVYRFGGPMPKTQGMRTTYVPPVYSSPQPMAQAPAAPVQVAPPPPPAPIAVAPTPAPKPLMQVKLQADSLFGFDQDALQSDGKRALDKLLVELKDVNVQSIQVTGHTDRLGTKAYNTELSTRRAESVRDYLVQVGGISAGQVSVAGAGSTQPETPYGECQGVKTSQKLITCLRADRRVEVDVKGTQQTR
jgi:OOP family OmpA-OmpF porin